MLQYDDKLHHYWDEQGDIPGISRILKPISDVSSIPEHVLRAAGDRGTEIHKFCESYDHGLIEEYDCQTEYAKYYDAYLSFLKQTQVKWLMIERKLMCKNPRFAGRLDRVGIINGKNYLIDIKTSSSKYPWWIVQLVAQMILVEPIFHIDEIRSLHLTSDGKHKLIPYEPRKIDEAIECFYSLANVCHWEMKNGGKAY